MARNKYPEKTTELILNEALKLFIEKGYENTSIQDIINNLGGLSKGAIYYHFKSKEDIFSGVIQKISDENAVFFDKIRDDNKLTGYEKLKFMIDSASTNPNNQAILAMKKRIISDPKFLMNQISEIYEVVVPKYIQPIIEQGIKDGSLKTSYPKELAEVIIILLNLWINPIITQGTPLEKKRQLDFFDLLLKGIGIDILDEKIISQYVNYWQ